MQLIPVTLVPPSSASHSSTGPPSFCATWQDPKESNIFWTVHKYQEMILEFWSWWYLLVVEYQVIQECNNCNICIYFNVLPGG